MTEIEEEPKDQVYSEDDTLEKEITGIAYDKNKLLDNEEEIEILGLAKNRWGKHELLCVINGEESRLRLSKANFNFLIDGLGSSLKDWIGKKVKVSGEAWEGNEKTDPGVTLVFDCSNV